MKKSSKRLIQPLIKLSLTAGVYWILLFEVGVAVSSQNNRFLFLEPETISQNTQTSTSAQQLFEEAEKLAQQRTIPSQLQAIKKWSEARLQWQKLGNQSQEALTLLKLGETYKNLGATTPALEYYTEALTLYQTLNNRSQEAFTLSQIGSVYIIELNRLKDEQNFQPIHGIFVNSRQSKLLSEKIRSTPEKALEFYKKSLQIYQDLNDLSGEARILTAMAESQYLHDDENHKQKLFKKALELYQEIGDKPGEALVLSYLSELNLIEYRNDKLGVDLFNQANAIYQNLAQSQDHNFTTSQAQANLLKVAIRYWWGDNQQKALEFQNQALKIYQEIEDKQGEAVLLSQMGYYYGLREARQKQLEYYTQALRIYQEIGDRVGESKILDKIGLIYTRSGDLEQALEFYNQELETLEKLTQFYTQLGDIETASIYDYRQPIVRFRVGKIYAEKSNTQKEAEIYNQARIFYQKWQDQEGEASFLIKIAEYYGSQDSLDRMVEFLDHAITVYRETGDRQAEADLLRDQIAGIYFYRLKDADTGFKTLNQALKIYREIGEPKEVARTLSRIGLAYLNLAEDEPKNQLTYQQNALEYYSKAIFFYREVNDFSGEVYSLRQIGKIYYELGNKEKALEAFNHAGKVFQENGEYEKAVNIIISIAEAYTRRGDQETGLKFYQQAIPIYQQLGDYEKEAWILRIIGQLYYELENINQAVKTFDKAPQAYQKNSSSPEERLYQRSGEAWTLYEIGRTYTELGDFKKALDSYQQALPIYEQEQDALWGEERTLDMLIRMSRIYLYFEESELAEQFCNKSLNQAQEMLFSNARILAEVFREIGKLCYQIGETETALKSFEQYGKLYKPNRGNQKVRNLSFINESFFLVESEETLEFCKKSSSLTLQIPDIHPAPWDQRYDSNLLKAPNQEIAKLCNQIASSENPLKSLDQFRRFYQQSGISKEVRGLMRVAEDYTELGDSKQALNFVNRAKSVSQKYNFPEGEINTLTWISRIYSQAEDYQNSLDFLTQGLRISQKIDSRSQEASLLTEIGDRYLELKDEEKALEFYQKALIIYQDFDNYRKQTEILNRIAVSYEQLQDLEKALEFYQKALKISQENNSPYLIFILRSISKLYLKIGELEKALDFLKQALNFSETPSSLYTQIGEVYSDLGELEKALESFNTSLELLGGYYPEGRAENLFGMARVERKKGNINTALTQIETAVYIIEKTRSRKVSPEERLTFFASKQDYYEFYIDLLMELHQQNPSQGYDAQALNISERSKARSLLELLTEANTDIRKGVEPELVIQERSLQQQLDAVERRRVEIYNNENNTLEQRTAIEQERQYLLRKYEEVQTKIREKSPSYAALTQPQPLTLKQIQQQILDEDTLLLQYALGEKRSFLWAITKDSMTSYELPPKATIEKAVRDFYRSAVNRRQASPEALIQASKPLYEMILSPVYTQLNHQRLAIVSDGILHYLPFSAVSLPSVSSNPSTPLKVSKKYSPLVTTHEIVHLPSASTLGILRQEAQQRKPAPKSIAILADPVFSTEDSRLQTPTLTQSESWEQYNLNRSARQVDIGVWQRLPGTRTEAEAILAFVPESESTHAFDFAANRAIATDPKLSQYKIIHFATHGLFNSVNPELSGIVLSMIDKNGNSLNGFLRLHDIFNLDFSADLVVLSACKTGIGKQVRGEGLVGLTRGFMYAGTPRVLVSLWDVDDVATAEIMTRFYRLMLQEKFSPTEALRQAQLEMQTETEWKSPHYWAAFTLQGEWQ
ncbi:MAG: tetratricopeptide repeat protein [Cyanobacteria bacterium J06592_8]